MIINPPLKRWASLVVSPRGHWDNVQALERLRTDTMPFVNLPEKKGAHALGSRLPYLSP